MSDPTTALPFELAFRGDGTWRSRWAAEQLFVVVGGTEAAPTASQLATLQDVVARWPAFKAAVMTYVRGLAADEHVPLDPASRGGFAAGSCGFAEDLVFSSIAVTDDDAPARVVITFYTGYPDGYATYAVALEHGVPVAIHAFAS